MNLEENRPFGLVIFFVILHPIRTKATYVKDKRNFTFLLLEMAKNSNFFL
jgi:hypothetical protein